jgi:myo-inositol-1(or 4)-monophosphatase
MLHLQNITHQVADLARKVGEFIKQERVHFDSRNIEHKGVNDLVSYVDKEAEKLIVAQLKTILPQADFVTEEGTEIAKVSDLYWVVDPLDGTTNFLHGLPVFSISIGLIQNKEVVVGVVYEINQSECFTAFKGGGAYRNSEKISISPINDLKESLIATGFPYDLLNKADVYFEIMKELQLNSHGLRRLGSAAVDLCYVACGRFEAYYEFNLKPWDVTAGILIVQEAGGVVTDFSNSNSSLNGLEILAAGNIHAPLLAIIQKHW